MELKKNDLVVVPGLGVGRVEGLQEVSIGAGPVPFFCIDMGEESGLFWVPEDNVDACGIRRPMDKATAAGLIERIVEQEAPRKRANWRRRQKRYQETLVSNCPETLAEMIGELVAVRAAKRVKKQTLSFGESRLLERAMAMLFDELTLVTGKARKVLEASVQTARTA
jgi:RNA polymerase-interacting CarD/CdnL/TRCF family regulator